MSTHNLLEPVNCLVHAERSYCDATVGLIKSECVRAGFAALPNRKPGWLQPCWEKCQKSSAEQKQKINTANYFPKTSPKLVRIYLHQHDTNVAKQACTRDYLYTYMLAHIMPL